MMTFEAWCAEHAPGFLDSHAQDLVIVDSQICLSGQAVQHVTKQIRRPVHHMGIALATNKQPMTLLPGCVPILGPYMKHIQLTAKGAWMVSCGKDVLGEGLDAPVDVPQGTVVCLVHGTFFVGIGTVLTDSFESQDRIISLACDIGRHLHGSSL